MHRLFYWWKRLTFRQSSDASNLNIDFLTPYATMFGSRAWGVAKRNSDVDFIVAERDSSTCESLLTQHSIPYRVTKDYYGVINNINFIYNGFKYQLTVVDNDSYYHRCLASQILTTFPGKLLLSERYTRHDYYDRLWMGLSMCKLDYIPTSILTHIQDQYPELLI